MLLNLIEHPQVVRCLVNVFFCFFLFSIVNLYSYKKNCFLKTDITKHIKNHAKSCIKLETINNESIRHINPRP